MRAHPWPRCCERPHGWHLREHRAAAFEHVRRLLAAVDETADSTPVEIGLGPAGKACSSR